MKRKSMITMLVIALMLVLSLTVLSACGKNKDDNKDDPPATYSVTVTNGTGGGEFAEGATVTITANAPATGKEFTSWTIEGVTVDDKTKAEINFTMPANAVTATANYDFIDYTVTVTGGTADKATAHYGDAVTITANAPETGKEFTSWTLSGVTVDDKTKAEITFTMPANAVTATANYGDVQYEFALENCTADKESAKFGEQVTFTADVFEDKRFVGWSVKGVDETGLDLTKSPLTITMPANDINVTAQLEQLYKITVSGGCTADKEWAAEGEQVTVTKPTPPEGHAFYWWSTGITQDWSNRENTVTFTMPAGDVQISASKVLLNYLFTMVGGTATGVKSGEPNTVTDGRSNGFDYGTDVTITANTPETGKRFTGWTITGVDTSELVLTDRELTFTMPCNAVTVTANFSDLVEHDVTVTGGVAQVGEGTLMTSLKAYCGDAVTLTAYQSTDKTFVKWTIAGIDTEGLDLTQRVLRFTMPDNDVTATAEFENVPTNLTFDGNVATSGELRYVNYDSKSFRLPLGSGQDLCTYTIELSNSAFTFKVYGSDGEVVPYDNGDGVMCIDINRDDNYTIRVVNTGSAANCTLTVTKV